MKKEEDAQDTRMVNSVFDSYYATVSVGIDGLRPVEQWEVDLSGEIVSPPRSHEFIERTRPAKTADITIERGARRYSGSFAMAGKIPARWKPCSEVH